MRGEALGRTERPKTIFLQVIQKSNRQLHTKPQDQTARGLTRVCERKAATKHIEGASAGIRQQELEILKKVPEIWRELFAAANDTKN